MRIGLILLSALVVLAFVEEASADPRGLAEDRWGNVYDSYEECQKALEQQENDYGDYKLMREELECKPTHWGGWIALSIFGADYRDDLVAVSDNESIIFSTGWGTRLEAVVRQVNHK